MAGVHRRNIYNAKLHGRTDIDQMLPAERKHLIAIQRLCKEQEKEGVMEVNDKRYQTLLSRAEALLLEARSIYAEIYSLRPEVEAVNRKRQRLDLEREMRGRLIKSAKIKVR